MRATIPVLLLFALPTAALGQSDPVQDAIQRYKAEMATQRAQPGPSVELTRAITSAAQDAVTAILKDPGSAQWGQVRAFQAAKPNQIDVCGQVNAKNSFGGYGGMQPYHVVLAATRAGLEAIDAHIATPNRRGDFYSFAPFCNPASW